MGGHANSGLPIGLSLAGNTDGRREVVSSEDGGLVRVRMSGGHLDDPPLFARPS